MATIEVLKEGDKFIARLGKNRLHAEATMDFRAHSSYGGGYVNVKLDGIDYKHSSRPNQSLNLSDNWEIEVKAPLESEVIDKMPVPTLFKMNGLTYIKVGPDIIVEDRPFVRIGPGTTDLRVRAFRPAEFNNYGTIQIIK